MTIVVLLGALAVLCVAALVAVGRGDRLADVEPDRSPWGRLPDGHLRADDVRSLRFSLVLRGYRMDEVDAVLARLAEVLAERDERIAALEAAGPSSRVDEEDSKPWPSSS